MTTVTTLPQRERRSHPGQASLRASDGALSIRLGIPYDERSQEISGFVEVVRPGAFRRALRPDWDLLALWNHEAGWPLGRKSNGTLTLRDTAWGLEAVVLLNPEDSLHRDVAARIQRRDVIGASFGFETIEDRWSTEPDGSVLRELLEVETYDLSPVSYPAYPNSIAADASDGDRSAIVGQDADWRRKLALHERLLRVGSSAA